MNLQAEAVAGAVEEALHSSLLHSRLEAARIEQSEDVVVDLPAIGAVMDGAMSQSDPFLDQRIDLLQFLARPPSHHRSGEIAEVTGGL